MSQDVLHHGAGDEGLVAAVGPAQQQRLGGGLSGQGQGGQGVHDQVDPQHLHRLQWRVLEWGAGQDGYISGTRIPISRYHDDRVVLLRSEMVPTQSRGPGGTPKAGSHLTHASGWLHEQ